MVCKIGGERVYLWRAVDNEGVVLDLVVQKRRDMGAALKLLKMLLRNQGVEPETMTTDGLSSYGSARICRSVDESERCWASSPEPRPSGSSQPMPRSTTRSTTSAISSAARRCESFEQGRTLPGTQRSPRSQDGLQTGCARGVYLTVPCPHHRYDHHTRRKSVEPFKVHLPHFLRSRW